MSMKKFFAMKNASRNKRALRPTQKPAGVSPIHLGPFCVESLEVRATPSVGLGPLKSASFIDADGDKVKISLKGPSTASMLVTLDGGANNNADVQSIAITGGDATTQLTFKVKSVNFKAFDETQGKIVSFKTAGFTNVTSITSATSLRGIAGQAAFGNISVVP